MKSAYNPEWICNLFVTKQAKLWCKHDLIQPEQFNAICDAYKTPLFHPNIAIRLLLFIATIIAVSGVCGLVMLVFSDAGESVIGGVCIALGIVGFMMLERVFITKNHYKSGVTEGIAYMSCGFVIVGIAIMSDFDQLTLIQFTCLLVFGYAAFRYLDLILTLAFMFSFSWMIFYHCYEGGEMLKSIIPFVFMITFTGIYFLIRKFSQRDELKLWSDNLLILEGGSLLLIYAGGNYLVVRELSVNLMNLDLQPDEDIPFAFLFYFFTVIIPLVFLWMGIKTKDKVLLRIALIVLAFSVFTFKYYYSFGHPEIALMIAGIISIMIAVLLLRYLKESRNGFTSENILSSSWANVNAEAFILSQTMGGNQPGKIEVKETGGGSSGGGGASSTF